MPPFPDATEPPSDADRQTRIDELCARLEGESAVESPPICEFAREFLLARIPPQILAERSLDQLSALIRGAFDFLQRSRRDVVNVEVVAPEEEGWEAPVTVVRAEVGDRPFVVDTIREYLNGQRLPILHYIYRVLSVKRDSSGGVVGVASASEGEPRSLVHCEVPPIPDPERRRAVREELVRRLEDVVLATDDFAAMLDAAVETGRGVARHRERFPDRAVELGEIEEFLRWLAMGNFVFLGYREYTIEGREGERTLHVEAGSGLGILRREASSRWSVGVPLAELPSELLRRVLGGPLLITSKTNAEATVHRSARMDYVGVKKLSATGEVLGEHRFLGLFTSKAYAEHAETIPILRQKLDAILLRSEAAPGSHDYKEIITIFNSMPKEELFQGSVAELERDIQMVLGLLFLDEVAVSIRSDPVGRGVSVMVILPRGTFSGDVRRRIQDVLIRRFEGGVLNYHLAMGAGDQPRLHFYLSATPEALARAETEGLAAEIRQIIRSWEDRLRDQLIEVFGASEAHRLAALYAPAFKEEYRAAALPEVAVQDVTEFERLRAEGGTVAVALREPRGRGRAEAFESVTVLKLYLVGERLVLSDFMPILENVGLRVIEVAPFALSGEGLPRMMIYAFAVQEPDGTPVALDQAERLAEALLAIRSGDTTNDPFNALVTLAGLRWREVDVIRTYGNYAFQAGVIAARYGAARTLTRHPGIARLLADLFRARFDPAADRGGQRGRARDTAAVKAAIDDALEAVTTLSDDRVVRRLVSLIEATVRTNYFRGGGDEPTNRNGGAPYISIKIRHADMEDLRRSRLLFEIYVFSSRMEGVHLRGAPVSRGGLRWSDRHDDFRTEVLGLVQTQIVKNAVIVPGGSKGGFVAKRALPNRGAMLDEAAEQYRTLIRGMLDLTDNIVGGRIVPPPAVVRYDGDDPYLVVAADKGTAHLSDVANEVAAEYTFWLGDAFASGGSQGYDHKREGITARGAWECVKRHFRELGKDIQNEPFTVAGIGDMGGDVFGNGMLLSRRIRLIAAFDHRHVFIDPDPDPELSYRERERLFALDRSSWEDYDRSRLSPGAMIVARASKEIALTPEAGAALGLDDTVSALDGEALIRAVLKAPVELLWNGGIGTYVKDAEESNVEVGDGANDAVRVDAGELRCRVIGEGGNLGLTQRARIAYALAGGRLNTDAIDNSGGVDMSDHEVNLKILLAPLVESGALSLADRNRLLAEMTPEVSQLVLANSRGQSLAVSLDESRSREALAEFSALITLFERDRLFDRAALGIPGSEELAERAQEGIGLTRPTLCTLLAYVKLQTQAQLLTSTLPDEPATEQYLIDYFPRSAVEAAGGEGLRGHRLRREIVAAQLVNELVDLMGASFLHRVARDTGRSIEAVAAAWHIGSRIAGAAEFRADLDALEDRYPAAVIYRWFFGLARVLERTARWILTNVEAEEPLQPVIDELGAGLARLRGEFASVVAGGDRELFEERRRELATLGVEGELADRIITLRFLPELLDILRIARESTTDALQAASGYYVVAEKFGIGWLQNVIRSFPAVDPWDKRLVQSLGADLQRAHRIIVRKILECGTNGNPVAGCLRRFEEEHSHEAQLYRQLLAEARMEEAPPLAAAALAVHALVTLSGE